MRYDYIPSVSQIHKSLKHRSKEYFLENSLHGVSYFMNSSRPRWERIMWLILTLASLSTTIGIIRTIWDKFQTEPTLTELDMVTNHIEFDFPQILLCFDWPRLNHSHLVKMEKMLYEEVYNWQLGKPIEYRNFNLTKQKNFHQIFQTLMPACSTLYNDCIFSGKKIPCSKNFAKVITSVGACCKFNASKAMTIVDSPWALSFLPSIYPIRIYLINKMDIGPQRDDKPWHVIYEPTIVEFFVWITYTTPAIHHLTLHQRQCHYENEGMSLNNCELHCQFNKILKKCGCVPWFLALSQQEECSLSKYSCASLNYIDILDCNCLLPCDHTTYNGYKIMPTKEDSSKTLHERKTCTIALSRWPTARFRRKIRFGYLDLLVSFGGIASLFLGYSLLVNFEFVYYFSLRSYFGAVLDISRKKCNIIKKQVKQSKTSTNKFNINSIHYNNIY